eukprot:COSAG01_NODE_33295_length_566_cov_4.152034_1_plen_50_part_01
MCGVAGLPCAVSRESTTRGGGTRAPHTRTGSGQRQQAACCSSRKSPAEAV